MSKRCTTVAVLLTTLVWSGSMSLAGWSIFNPMDNSTIKQGDDIYADGGCTHHPSRRWVGFGTPAAGGVESSEASVDSQEVMPGGPWTWSVTLDEPPVGWILSPLDGMGMPIGDHEFWVLRIGGSPDAETTGHMVIAP